MRTFVGIDLGIDSPAMCIWNGGEDLHCMVFAQRRKNPNRPESGPKNESVRNVPHNKLKLQMSTNTLEVLEWAVPPDGDAGYEGVVLFASQHEWFQPRSQWKHYAYVIRSAEAIAVPTGVVAKAGGRVDECQVTQREKLRLVKVQHDPGKAIVVTLKNIGKATRVVQRGDPVAVYSFSGGEP